MPADTTSQDAWQGGWWRGAEPLPSPNFGPRPAGAPIDLIVVHSISLPPGEFEGDFVQALFTNRLDWDAHPYFEQIRGLEVSAHFYVRRDGAALLGERGVLRGIDRHRGCATVDGGGFVLLGRGGHGGCSFQRGTASFANLSIVFGSAGSCLRRGRKAAEVPRSDRLASR